MTSSEDWLRFKRAFPASVASDVAQVVPVLGRVDYEPSPDIIGRLQLSGEELHIPARVYLSDPDEERVSRLSADQRLILSCIYSRHHNGYTREAHLRRIIRADRLWIAPYVVQLIGEYVIEILQLIEANSDVLGRDTYRAFVDENPVFLNLTRARVVSYWNAYHRRQTPAFENYVGHRLLRALNVADR